MARTTLTNDRLRSGSIRFALESVAVALGLFITGHGPVLAQPIVELPAPYEPFPVKPPAVSVGENPSKALIDLLAKLADAPPPEGISARASEALDRVVDELQAGYLEAAARQFKTALAEAQISSRAETQSAVLFVLREAYLDGTNIEGDYTNATDLQNAAAAIGRTDEQSEQVSDHLAKLKQLRVVADTGIKLSPDAITPATTERDRPPGYPVWKKQMLSDSGLEQYIARLQAQSKKLRAEQQAAIDRLSWNDPATRQRLDSLMTAYKSLQRATRDTAGSP